MKQVEGAPAVYAIPIRNSAGGAAAAGGGGGAGTGFNSGKVGASLLATAGPRGSSSSASSSPVANPYVASIHMVTNELPDAGCVLMMTELKRGLMEDLFVRL